MQRKEISAHDRALIDRSLRSDDSAEHLMVRTSQVLSHVSKNIGIVISPPISGVALSHIQFLRLTDDRILVILVSRAGIVQNRLIHIEEHFSQTELDQAARYLTEHFKDKSLTDIRLALMKMIGQDRALFDSFLQRVITLGSRTFAEAPNESRADIYLDGAANLIRTPEFSDMNRMRTLLETIEQKSRLAVLLNQCIKEDTEEVKITIGAENALPGIEDCTLITSRYSVDDKTQGSLGILGPTRMEYGKAISLVDYVARLFGRVLGTGN